MARRITDRMVNRALLLNVGSRMLLIIKQRTLRGKYLPGSTGTSEYSTTPMPLPWGGLQKAVRNSRTIRNMIDSGEADVFQSRGGRTWILLQGGYRKFRELAGKSTDHVTLSWSGQMMRDLKIKDVNVGLKSVTIGFTDARSRELARYHDVLGAGKSKVTHKFMGFTTAERGKLNAYIQRLIHRSA